MNKHEISKGNLIKETNYKKILQLIGKGQQLTKLDIAYTLKISIPTVTTNINELKQEGIIEEIESDIYTGGRKPKVIKLIPDSRISIGMSITKSKVVVVIMNLLEEVMLIKDKECEGGILSDYIQQGKELIQEAIEELNIKEESILGIGISIPGTLNQKLGVIEQTNMGYKEISLNHIYDLFNTTVYVENEANLSLLAEKSIRKYDDLKNLLYIGINEGLGGGIFVNGDLFTGTSGRAGEFGHMRFIEKETGKSYRVEDQISTRSLVQHYEQKTGENIESFSNFEKLVKTQDRVATEILMDSIEILLMTIYNLTMVVDIQEIIIGGKVGRLIKSEPKLLEELMNKYSEIMDKLDLNICFSEIRNTSATGAALLPIIDFYKISNENE
ncbi:MAG: ROK family transcriptional regulator [Candidatus Cellulosilyticum pullistercoris]|uniref:ROK family transcriptional regulator n=1 Tax=Candidatus Cellulosilyticum pullistercoris TaxID=2838521 RepID=A0A9E2NLQ8_9FIRM|nr:ROK family transcriptional regulator [Candidatus Cellulosilyticum pullistercoris]